MKISLNWIKELLPNDLSVEEIAQILTDTGLEVEKTERYESIRGGLAGLVVGEIVKCEAHPNADKLKLTEVNIGLDENLPIVCGAPNVSQGQKVIVATVGTTLYPINGDSFKIKKAKIRGEVSIGMICAEDEIGLGESHDGIMTLPDKTKIGLPAKDVFNVYEDWLLEIGLTPNRTDAMGHIGVARDLLAALKHQGKIPKETKLKLPSTENFKVDNNNLNIPIIVENLEACPRYSGISISNIKVQASPEWLQNRLKTIGLTPINNIVDITNYVQHEMGHPLHAFDADKIEGNTVVVKNALEKENFKTLDEKVVKLSANDLMICDKEKSMCIAGIYGGFDSGVSNNTSNIFLESAYFNPVSIRKTAKHHGLNTDASFRYERGIDPNDTLKALKRTALLIKEIAGGEISSEIQEIKSADFEKVSISLKYDYIKRLIGQDISKQEIQDILVFLEFDIEHTSDIEITVKVPTYRVDVTRPIDIVEEIIRIYGLNNIDFPKQLHTTVTHANKPRKEDILNEIRGFLSNKGCIEVMNNSLTAEKHLPFMEENTVVRIINPLSNELNIMRQNLLFGALENISLNIKHKNGNLKLFEIGKQYFLNEKYIENEKLLIAITGRKNTNSWQEKEKKISFYDLKSIVENLFKKYEFNIDIQELEHSHFEFAFELFSNAKSIGVIGKINKKILDVTDISQEVFAAELDLKLILRGISKRNTVFKPLVKFPSVKRDFSLLIDKEIKYSDIERVARKNEKKLLKEVSLFDVYEGSNLEGGKKSYAVSFILQDENATLTDKTIDKAMNKIKSGLEKELAAELR